MWTSAPFPRQKLHMGAWNPTMFAFWHIITRKDIAMEPLRQERSTLPGHLGFFLMGGKLLSSPKVLWDCTEGRKEGKSRMPCLAMKLLQGITQTKSLYPWRKWRCFSTASLNPTHLDEPLAAVTLDRAVLLSLFLIFPLSRSPLLDLPLSLVPDTSLLLILTSSLQAGSLFLRTPGYSWQNHRSSTSPSPLPRPTFPFLQRHWQPMLPSLPDCSTLIISCSACCTAALELQKGFSNSAVGQDLQGAYDPHRQDGSRGTLCSLDVLPHLGCPGMIHGFSIQPPRYVQGQDFSSVLAKSLYTQGYLREIMQKSMNWCSWRLQRVE